jgi:hypothetical protein
MLNVTGHVAGPARMFGRTPVTSGSVAEARTGATIAVLDYSTLPFEKGKTLFPGSLIAPHYKM